MLAALVALMILGGAAFLVAVGRQWLERRTRERPPVSLPLQRGPHHMHYCTRCDRQWEHAGSSHECTRSWATPCPGCTVPAPACLIIVQRYHRGLYERLRAQRGPAVDVIIDRRRDERRQGGPYAGLDRRKGQRRRPPTSEERALWSELRHLLVTRRAESGAAPWRGGVSGR